MLKSAQRLIERCIRREEKAWEEFIERFSGLLYYSARERLKRNKIAYGQEDIEDIVQAVFLEIWEKEKLKEVRDRKKITAWLSVVAQTRAINYMKRKKERLLVREELYKIDNINLDTSGQLDEDFVRELDKAMEGFNAREKLIFKLSAVYGKRHREIASFMHMPVNTVSTIMARKKKLLREKLKNF